MKLLPIIIAAVLALPSCTSPENYFTEYEGVNLIGGYDFDSGSWSIDYGKTTVFDYVNFEAYGTVSDPPAGGPPAGAPVYRLEIVNLMPNGDFEQPLSGWTAVDNFPVGSPPTVGTSPKLDGNALEFSISDPNDYIDFDFSDGSDDLLDGPVADATYIVRFDFLMSSAGNKYFEYKDAAVDPRITQWYPNIGEADVRYRFPDEFIDSVASEVTILSAANIFAIGTYLGIGSPQTGYIDNFRVTRSDVNHKIRMNRPFVDTAAAENAPEGYPLLPGTYRFSVYVKADPTATYSGSGLEEDNRFDPSGVTLGVQVLDQGDIVAEKFVSSGPADSGTPDGWADWHELSMVFDVSQYMKIPSDTTMDVLSLYIIPTAVDLGQNSKDVGSILISAPALEFLPEGE